MWSIVGFDLHTGLRQMKAALALQYLSLNPYPYSPYLLTYFSFSGLWGPLRPGVEDYIINHGPTPMRQQHPMNVIQVCFSPTRLLSSMFLLVSLASFYLQVPMSAQSSSCCRDLSSVPALSIAIFSLVWGLTLVYYLWLCKALCCSDGCARISSALSAGRWDETHLICWDQLVSASTFQHHTTVQTSRLSSECVAWSSDLQIL